MLLTELKGSGEVSQGPDGVTATLKFMVVGLTDGGDVIDTVANYTTPTVVAKGVLLGRKQIGPAQPQGGRVWTCDVQYDSQVSAADAVQTPDLPAGVPEPPPPPPVPPVSPPPPPPDAPAEPADADALGSKWTFTTTGGTARITTAVATRYRRTAADNGLDATEVGTAPDTKKVIGLTADGVEGTDVAAPNFEFDYTVSKASVQLPYIRDVLATAPQLNSTPWLGFAAQEVLWLGANGSGADFGPASLTHHFRAGKTRAMEVTIGGINVPEVRPHDVVDVRYTTQTIGTGADKITVSVPQFVYVHQVYGTTDFATLGIFSPPPPPP